MLLALLLACGPAIDSDDPSRELLDLAAAARKAGDSPSARSLLEQAVYDHPKDAEAWAALAEVLVDDGDPKAAIDAAERAVQLDPDRVGAALTAARLRLDRDDVPGATKDLRAVLLARQPEVAPPDDVAGVRDRAMLLAAKAFQQDDRTPLAIAVANRWLADRGAALDPAVADGLRAVAAADPGSPTMTERPELAALKGQLEGAAGASPVHEGATADPSGSSEASPAGDKSSAVEEGYRRLLDAKDLSDLERWDVHEGLGLALAYEQKPSDAAVEFGKAVQAAHDLPPEKELESRYNLACALSEAREPERAVSAVEDVLWVEWLAFEPDRRAYATRIARDGCFEAVRPRLQKVVDRYR